MQRKDVDRIRGTPIDMNRHETPHENDKPHSRSSIALSNWLFTVHVTRAGFSPFSNSGGRLGFWGDVSFQSVQWAFDQEIFPSTKKFILVALCNFSSDTGLSFPSVETIGRITGLKHEAIRNGLAQLVTSGILKDTGKRTGATSQIKVYRLPEEAYVKDSTKPSLKDSAKTRQRLGKDSVSQDPSICRNRNSNSNCTSGDAGDRIQDQYHELISAYSEEYCLAVGVPYRPGGRDFKAAKDFSQRGGTVEDIHVIAKIGFALTGFLRDQTASLPKMVAAENEIRAAKGNNGHQNNRPMHGNRNAGTLNEGRAAMYDYSAIQKTRALRDAGRVKEGDEMGDNPIPG